MLDRQEDAREDPGRKRESLFQKTHNRCCWSTAGGCWGHGVWTRHSLEEEAPAAEAFASEMEILGFLGDPEPDATFLVFLFEEEGGEEGRDLRLIPPLLVA